VDAGDPPLKALHSFAAVLRRRGLYRTAVIDGARIHGLRHLTKPCADPTLPM